MSDFSPPRAPGYVRTLHICIFVIMILWPTLAGAGDRDSHLTATHFIARMLGYDEREARLIASAAYSIDVNAVTRPSFAGAPPIGRTPRGVMGGLMMEAAVNGPLRDRITHSLNSSPQAAIEQLERLRSAVETASGDQQLRYVGQYLHALQDSFYHQYRVQTDKGYVVSPYNQYLGHYDPTKPAGPAVDGIATHFDGAVRAMIATKATLLALREQRDTGRGTLPAPGSFRIYDANVSLPPLLKDNLDLARLASAIAGTYDKGKATPRHERLETALQTLWGKLTPVGGASANISYAPLLKLKGETDIDHRDAREGADKVEYDRDPSLLMDPIRAPLHLDGDGQIRTTGAVAPGGISLSGAAAAAMPIEIEVDSIRFDNDNRSIVLSGKRDREPQVFDAAIFLTALRLACSRTDPYFSLDPPEWDGYAGQLSAALSEIGNYADEVVRTIAERTYASAPLSVSNGVELRGPAIVGFSLYQRDPSRYRAILSKYPLLRPRLVFGPEWLRETKVGKILYDADVMLKEFVEGAGALDPDRQPAVDNVQRYVSARRSSLANGLRSSLGLAALDERDRVHDWRVWLDLADADSPDSAGLHPTPRIQNRDPISDLWARAAAAADTQLRSQGLSAVAGDIRDRRDTEISDVKSIRDLSMVVPQMFARARRDGKDVAGYDPDLWRVTSDVSRRFWTYAEHYPALRRLVQVFRAYVAGRKIAETAPESCAGTDVTEFPLLPAQKITETLPTVHPYPVLTLQLALLKVTGPDGSWQTRWQSATGYSGGVTISYNRVRRNERTIGTAVTDQVAALIDQRPADAVAWRGADQIAGSPRMALALNLDIRDDARNFVPVTGEIVLAELNEQLDDAIKKMESLQRPRLESNTPSAGESDPSLQALKNANDRLVVYIYILAALAILGLGGTGYGLIMLWHGSARLAANPFGKLFGRQFGGFLGAPANQNSNQGAPPQSKPASQLSPPAGFKHAPHVIFHRQNSGKAPYRQAMLRSKLSGNFGTIDPTLSVIAYTRDGQNKLVLSVSSYLPLTLLRGGRQLNVTPNTKAALAITPGDRLKFDDWEIVFEDKAASGAAQP